MGHCFFLFSCCSENMTAKEVIAQFISAIPSEWQGTTFKNHNLLGREGFASNLNNLLAKKSASDITTSDLEELGNAEDYLRVATNVATSLEVFLAREKGFTVDQVFTFASTTMPIIAVVLTVKKPVHLYIGDAKSPFTPEQLKFVKLLGGDLSIHATAPSAQPGAVVLALDSTDTSNVDGIIAPNVLYIVNTELIQSASILVIRKRMSTPMTTPMALAKLEELAGVPITKKEELKENDLSELYAHLQTLSGTDVNSDINPVICTAGLPTIASLWITLLLRGGADILMASTAYGGSSQLTDIITGSAEILRKHTFDIQGVNTDIIERISGRLNDLAADAANLMPLTVLFVEIPTNPDMKVPDTRKLAPLLQEYKKKSGKEVLLMVDTTFAPGSQVMTKFKELAPELPVLAFISLSKSVSRGITTAGTIVANHTDFSVSLVREVSSTAAMLDTTAKHDQLLRLINNHKGVEERCQKAYEAAAAVGKSLQDAVKAKRNEEMPLAFVKSDQAEIGFTSSTFSFNLPSPVNATSADNEALAQKFVDLLCAHSEFKPCVSFGQDNGLVYATVPATSTQGAIKEEDKAKQAVGGVQLVRLSFSPSVDVSAVCKIVEDAVAKIYAK